jgi:molybdopterin molybdotransferase
MKQLLTPDEAFSVLAEVRLPVKTEVIPLDQAFGRILAGDVISSRNHPPFDRVTMDGYAVCAGAIAASGIRVEKTVFAGDPEAVLENAENAIEIMTGSVLPIGCDAIVKYEDTERKDSIVRLKNGVRITPGQNIHREGVDLQAGALLLPSGTMLDVIGIGSLASNGVAAVPVRRRLRVAVVSTGDELVEPGNPVETHQLYVSNRFAVKALLEKHGALCETIHVSDDEVQAALVLDELLRRNDVLVLSGGVSMGKKDFIPSLLARKGIKPQFHGVMQRPGKPFWFGKSDGHVVFALPGNPVSVLLCTVRYVIPWLHLQYGINSMHPDRVVLVRDLTFTLPLTWFVPVMVEQIDGKRLATPYPGNGSGDFLNLRQCSGFLELPEGGMEFKAGESYRYWGW